MEPWDNLVREPQERAVKLIQENIKPGKPLMVLGLTGCGKYELTRKAIEKLEFIPYTFFILGANHDPNNELGYSDSYETFIQSIPGNGVLVFDGIDSANPKWMQHFLTEAKHPDRPVVFVGTGNRNVSMILAMQCKILKFTNDFPAELLEIE